MKTSLAWMTICMVAAMVAAGCGSTTPTRPGQLVVPLSLAKPPESVVSLVLADYAVESPYTKVVQLVRLSDGQYLALSARDPNMGCTVPWNTKAQLFSNPCHGAKYNIRGEVISGPAIRGLDRFPARVDMAHKELIIDVGAEPQHGPLPH